MRTNTEIEDALMSEAMAATGLSTKRATKEEGLRLLDAGQKPDHDLPRLA
jgi:Arc/MetJ family transcription regulator